MLNSCFSHPPLFEHLVSEWNSLPYFIRATISTESFKTHLKTFYFKKAFPQFIWCRILLTSVFCYSFILFCPSMQLYLLLFFSTCIAVLLFFYLNFTKISLILVRVYRFHKISFCCCCNLVIFPRWAVMVTACNHDVCKRGLQK